MVKRELSCTVCGNVNWYTTMENSMESPLKNSFKKLYGRSNTTIWPSNPTTGKLPWENHNSKRYMDPSVYCSTVCSSQDMEATLMSINRWMNKEVVVHTYFEILLSHKKEWIWVSPSEVNEPRACYTEWSQKNRYCLSTHICEI